MEESSVQSPPKSPSSGTPPSVVRPAVPGGSWSPPPTRQNLETGYCIECWCPVYDGSDFCPDHAYLGIKRCDFCGRTAIVNDAGLFHCLRPECVQKAAER